MSPYGYPITHTHTRHDGQTAPDAIPINISSLRGNDITAADMSVAIERALLDIADILRE